jgi:hypothetical protein
MRRGPSGVNSLQLESKESSQMGKVLMEITMSLDGYTTGPEVSAEAPFGRGGERLHE